MEAKKIFFSFEGSNNSGTLRIDLLEIAAYMPLILENGADAGKGTTIILNSGETMAVSMRTTALDRIFSEKHMMFS